MKTPALEVKRLIRLDNGCWARILALPTDTCFAGQAIVKIILPDGRPGKMNHAVAQLSLKVPARTEQIALEFSLRLLRYLGREKLAQAVALNHAETVAGICHTHDFCDANVFMARAIRAVTGREPRLQADADIAQWNASWNLAMKNGFYL